MREGWEKEAPERGFAVTGNTHCRGSHLYCRSVVVLEHFTVGQEKHVVVDAQVGDNIVPTSCVGSQLGWRLFAPLISSPWMI